MWIKILIQIFALSWVNATGKPVAVQFPVDCTFKFSGRDYQEMGCWADGGHGKNHTHKNHENRAVPNM